MTEPPTATQWYIARDGKQHGPLSDAEIRMFVQAGHMRPTDLVWRAGFADWQLAANVFPPSPPSPQGAAPQPVPNNVAAAQSSSQTASSSADAARRAESRAQPASLNPSFGQAGDDPAARPAERSAQASAEAATRQHPAFTATTPRSGGGQVAPADQDEDQFGDSFEVEVPAPRRRFRLAAAMAGLALLVAGGGWFLTQNQDAILQMAGLTTGAADGLPVVKADSETKTAALDQEQPETPPAAGGGEDATSPAADAPSVTPVSTEVPSKPVVTPQMIDENFQNSALWRRLKADYPDWYNANVEAAARIVSAGTEADMAKHLITQLVDLRRQNAEHALAADTASLINIAQSFLANLKSLASHSASTCYSFIGQGESSPAVIALFPQRGYGEAIEAQIAAIFEAVANGRAAPVSRERATKADYDVLAGELTKLGWSKADLRVFADPKALAQTEPEKVCQMVQDWFTAHLAISDPAVQERLMFETLRPIVAG